MKGHIHSRIAKLLVVLALAVVASVMFVFVGCSSECEHEKTHTETVAATCTTAGSTKTVCDDCGETIKTEPIAALGHKWDEGKVVAATCAAGGYTLKTCTVCGTQQQTDLTEALPHAWKNTTTVEATCEKDGYTEQTCEACGATRRVNIVAAEGHKWENKEVAATCGTAGRTYQECSVCHEIRNQVTIPATGEHNWEKGDTVAVTCTTNGYTEYECSVCHATKQDDVVNATGHVPDKENVLRVEPTCTVDGYTWLACKKCGELVDTITILKATGHTYEWKVTKELTCTTDGTITGTCTAKGCDHTVSYTADQYAALDDQQKTALKISDAIYAANGGKEAFLQAEGHYYVSFKILNDATLNDVYHDAQHKYDTPTAGDKKDDPLYLNCQSIGTIKVDGKDVDYSDYSLVCLECNVKKDVEAHTPNVTPAHNCVAMEGDPDHAWECTLCGYKQDVEEHDYQLIDVKTGEVAAEGTAYNCLVKLACAECGALKNENEPRGPHAKPTSEDKEYLANCQHGMMCTICEEEVYGAKIPHNLVKVEAGTTVAGETAVASTCTVKGKDVWACSMCQELEKAGTEITWTRATSEAQSNETGNYFSKEADLLPHEWVSKTVSNNASDPNGDYCITTTWKIDTCKNCPATRIETTAAVAGERPVTDEQGRYDVDPGTSGHTEVYVTDPEEYENLGYDLPNCVEKGKLLVRCSNPGCKYLSTEEEITLEQYAGYVLKNEGTEEPTAEQIEAKLAELLKDQRFHAEKMYDCGHPYCPAKGCAPENDMHAQTQWTVSFEFDWLYQYANAADLELPTLDTFTAYYCWVDDVNMTKFAEYRAAFEEKYPDFTFAYYTDAEHKTLADFAVIGADKGEDQYTTRLTLYVTVGVDEAIFFTGNWAWYPGAQLDVNINFNNNYIPVADIDSILFEVIDVDGGEEGAPLTLATALSTNADGSKTLENLLAAAEEWSDPWLNEAGECVLTIGNFCNPNYEPVEGEEEWTFTQHESFTENSAYVAPLGNGQNALTGVTVRCTITAGDATFVVEAALVI